MSDAHAHHNNAPDHVPHVTPFPVYMKTFGALCALTIITVGVSRIDLGTSVNLGIALVIATIKAVTVAAFFMHLAADHKFHSVIFVSSVVFLLIFVSFTMFDTEARGKAEAVERTRPADPKNPFAKPTGLTTVTMPAAPAAAPPTPSASTSASASAAAPQPAPSASASADPASSADAPPATSASAPAVPSAAPSAPLTP